MLSKNSIVTFRLIFGVLTLSAIITQLVMRAQTLPFNPINFFSFFTIESNILAAGIFIASALALRGDKKSTTLDVIRGAATVYMVITGIVYALLLSGLEESLQTPIPWVNLVLHYAMPIAAAMDWLIDPPHRRITRKRMWLWLIFPIAYVIYSLIRGPLAGWYPYPFLDPHEQGYGIVALYVIGIALATTVVSFTIRAVGNYQAKKQ